jgi:hypothetical protein
MPLAESAPARPRIPTKVPQPVSAGASRPARTKVLGAARSRINAAPTAREGVRVHGMISALVGAGIAGGTWSSQLMTSAVRNAASSLVLTPCAVK